MNDAVQLQHDRNGWRVSKDISVGMIGAFIIQTLIFTWFLAGQNSKLNTVIDDNAAAKLAVYTKDDARKDRELMDSKLVNVQSREDEMIRRIALLEAQANAFQARLTK